MSFLLVDERRFPAVARPRRFLHAKCARATTALAFALLSIGCAARDPDAAAEIEALRVCHATFVEGIDVAEFQGAVDWRAVRDSGRAFGIARIGDGAHDDARFAENWAGMHEAGMIRGAYYFFRPTLDVDVAAARIEAAVGRLGDDALPVTIDVECMCPFSAHRCDRGPGCATPAEAAAALDRLVAAVEAATGKRPMIYASARVWDGPSYMDGAARESESALWVPSYGTGCVGVASGWDDWQLWQYAGDCAGCAPVPGVTGAAVDRDRWNGTIESLRAFARSDGRRTLDAGADGDASADAHTIDAAAIDAAAIDAAAIDAAAIDGARAIDAAPAIDAASARDGGFADGMLDRPLRDERIQGRCSCRAAGRGAGGARPSIVLALIGVAIARARVRARLRARAATCGRARARAALPRRAARRTPGARRRAPAGAP